MKITELEDHELRQRIENRFSNCSNLNIELRDVGALIYVGDKTFFATQRHTNPITGHTGQYYKCDDSLEGNKEICYLNAESIEVYDGDTDGICHSVIGNIIGYSRPSLGLAIHIFDREILKRLYERLDGRFPTTVFSCYENIIRGIVADSTSNQSYIDEEGTRWLN